MIGKMNRSISNSLNDINNMSMVDKDIRIIKTTGVAKETHHILGNVSYSKAYSQNETVKANEEKMVESFMRGDCLSGDTLVMDVEGDLYTLEDLACEYNSELEVTCIDKHGRLTTSLAHSFRIGQWTDVIYHIVLSSGQKIRATGNHPFLGASNEWVTAEEITVGTVLKTATYNPKVKNLLLSIEEVVYVRLETLPEKTPMYDFTVDKHENLFIADRNKNSQINLVVAHNSYLYKNNKKLNSSHDPITIERLELITPPNSKENI
jgi:uncharacterized protein YueI